MKLLGLDINSGEQNHISLSNGYFFSNHISNYLPIKAIYPRDKEDIVRKIKKIISEKSEIDLRSEYYRDIVNQY